ncbi:tRNA dihydrouridine synthase DusB [bacterium]|nr:tRNA dihydrouridine synthase DusB [bacterium]
MLPPISLFGERFGPIRYLMAPMAGISDIVFRSLIREMGAQAVVSELLSAEGLVRGGEKTRDMMRFDESERPVGIQIFGSSIASMTEAAKIVQAEGADFVDINFGCPVKKVVCDGAGAAWLKEPQKLGELLTSMKQALRIPLTIKIRTGWDESSINAAEVVKVAAECGVSWVAIHGRTRAQGYSGLADWELIRQVAVKSPIPIIGNGDIITADQAIHRIDQGYAHAVMVGRGALKNPWIFQQILGQNPDFDFVQLVNRHFDLAIQHRGKFRAFLSLKKFLAWYATGYQGASAFRQSIFSSEDIEVLRGRALEFFAQVNFRPKSDDGQPFLMGGHG